MKKKLNIDLVQSELRGGSAFFPGYKGQPSPTNPQTEAAAPAVMDSPSEAKQPTRSNETPPGVPPPGPQGVPPLEPLIPKRAKRPIRQRQPFDIYEDQYQVLKKIAAAEKGFENGRSMGQMVRDAIDAYLREHNAS